MTFQSNNRRRIHRFTQAAILLSGLATASHVQAAEPAPKSADIAHQPDKPALEFVQSFRSNSEGVSQVTDISTARFNGEINSIHLSGNFLYVIAKKNIAWFTRDLAAGRLTVAGNLPVRDGRFALANGRLYSVPVGDGKEMTWYELEAQTGKPVEKGTVPCPAVCGYIDQPLVGPGQRDLYIIPGERHGDKLLWFHIADDGTPVKSGEVAARGIGGEEPWMRPMTLSPDGKSLYYLSTAGDALLMLDRKPTGEIAYNKTFDLKPVEKQNKPFKYPSITITPDGKWLYASLLGYGDPAANHYRIFKRDPATGEVTFQETIREVQKEAGPLYLCGKHLTVQFLPNGTSGFWGSCETAITPFTIDPQTGHFISTGKFQGPPALRMAFDAENGFLYTGSGPDLLVVKTAKFAGGKAPVN